MFNVCLESIQSFDHNEKKNDELVNNGREADENKREDDKFEEK